MPRFVATGQPRVAKMRIAGGVEKCKEERLRMLNARVPPPAFSFYQRLSAVKIITGTDEFLSFCIRVFF